MVFTINNSHGTKNKKVILHLYIDIFTSGFWQRFAPVFLGSLIINTVEKIRVKIPVWEKKPESVTVFSYSSTLQLQVAK